MKNNPYLLGKHSEANINGESPDFQAGYQKGWWIQPIPENASEEFLRGYEAGKNHKQLDQN